jgi:hypothetical protein
VSAFNAASGAAADRRPRNKEKTLEELRYAMLRIKNRGGSLSVTAVANEVGIAPSTIHKVYPSVADEIREATGRGRVEQRDEAKAGLAEAKSKIRELREEVSQLEADLARIASLNETLTYENATLAAQLTGKVTKIKGSDL